MAYNANTMSFDLPDTDTVYVSGLPPGVSERDVEEYFGSIGVIKTDKKTRGKKIWLYRDKATGGLKGDGTVTYEDPFSAASAVEWFNQKEWKGSMVTVSLAEKKTGGGGGGGYGGGGYSSAPSPIDRLIAAVPWLLPLLDAFSYGRFLFYQFPLAARLVSPLAPLVSLYASIPFAPLVCFFGLYLGVVNNPQVSRFARFSAMQAVLVDILLVLPRLLESLASPPAQGWGLKAYITAQNSIWVLVAAVVAYGVGCAVLGKTARVPFVADAADAQIMR